MKKDKAYRLDTILECLVANKFLSKQQIETKLGETVIYRDLLTIRGYQHNNANIVDTILKESKRFYKLTPAGVAFIEDVGFSAKYKEESRSKAEKVIMLVLNIITALIAVTAFIISFRQVKNENCQINDLERRIDSLELHVNSSIVKEFAGENPKSE